MPAVRTVGQAYSHVMNKISQILHFHISHNTPYMPPKILHKHRFKFLLGRPGEMKNKGYAKFAGANNVHYRKCGSGVRIDNQVFLGMRLHSNARNACGALLKQ